MARPTENEIPPEYVAEWRYYSSAASSTDLDRLQTQKHYAVLADNGVRVSYIEPPVPANLVTLGLADGLKQLEGTRDGN